MLGVQGHVWLLFFSRSFVLFERKESHNRKPKRIFSRSPVSSSLRKTLQYHERASTKAAVLLLLIIWGKKTNFESLWWLEYFWKVSLASTHFRKPKASTRLLFLAPRHFILLANPVQLIAVGHTNPSPSDEKHCYFIPLTLNLFIQWTSPWFAFKIANRSIRKFSVNFLLGLAQVNSHSEVARVKKHPSTSSGHR